MNMIGIVGGVGPFAGIDLSTKIFTNTLAGKDQEHLPVAMLSIPGRIEDRTEYLMGRSNINPALAVAQIILQLEKIGTSVVGIPCNTMHAEEIFGVIEAILQKQGSKVQLLNMVGEVAAFIASGFSTIRRIGVLSTTGTWKTGIYARELKKYGFGPVVPLENEQEQIHEAIYNEGYGIKAHSNPVTQKARNQLFQGLRHLKKNGAQGVILGCTEISYTLPHYELEGLPLFDPTLILARSLIASSYPDKLKPWKDKYG